MSIPVPYIIAETAFNHEGNIDYLLRMIDEISSLNLNVVKFHLLFKINEYMNKNHPLINVLKKWLFTEKEWNKILKYSIKKNLDIVALCDDISSLRYINRKYQSIFAVELHAVSLNDYFMIKEAARFSGTVILGIGGSSLDEIEYAVDFLKGRGKKDILLMYGFQNYPTDYKQINLSKMVKIYNLFNLPVGYADHTAFNDEYNEVISSMATMMGFNVLEKHFTLDEGRERIDFQAAVGKEKMMKIKKLMSLAATVHGSGDIRMSDAELAYGDTGPMKKAIVARHNIAKGKKLTVKELCFKRTEKQSHIMQNQFFTLLGAKTIKSIKRDEIITYDKIRCDFKKGIADRSEKSMRKKNKK